MPRRMCENKYITKNASVPEVVEKEGQPIAQKIEVRTTKEMVRRVRSCSGKHRNGPPAMLLLRRSSGLMQYFLHIMSNLLSAAERKRE